MPPTQHSNSTAHKESDGLQPNGLYTLGEYSFRLERSSVPGSTNDQITAVCMQGGKNARKSIQVPSSTQIDGWYVEANETEASVYVVTDTVAPLVVGNIPCIGSPGLTEDKLVDVERNRRYQVETSNIPGGLMTVSDNELIIAWEQSDGQSWWQGYINSWTLWSDQTKHGGRGDGLGSGGVFQFDNKIVGFYHKGRFWNQGVDEFAELVPRANVELTDFAKAQSFNKAACIAWSMIYSATDGRKETLVARFAINLEDAGGDGPGSDWIDPGDYNDDWEEGDPAQILYVNVIGALSGRHNDPIEDPSYSYIPAEKDTVKQYGCGGDGGHGGGGGAGASTVVVHKFATNQADSKEVIAIARRHGYGSGGGKGGKGGDGCILVYY